MTTKRYTIKQRVLDILDACMELGASQAEIQGSLFAMIRAQKNRMTERELYQVNKVVDHFEFRCTTPLLNDIVRSVQS